MSVVANSVPEGASPPPEPPPRDYTDMTIDFREEKKDSSCGEDGDVKIRARIEACRQGMMQLDALRSKHIKLMQEMRGRLPTIPGCADVQARIKRSAAINDRSSLQSVDSGVSSLEQDYRGNRKSVVEKVNIMSSGSFQMVLENLIGWQMMVISFSYSTRPMPYSMYRKISIEQKEIVPEPVDNTPPIPIVATTIASTTSLRSDRIARAWRRQQQRPRSMFDHSPEQSPRRDSMIDTTSFMQITPPPVHRKMGVVGHVGAIS
ncbi:unnamed protein product [Nippostrongylus brasiliensis]|uniref:Uncharacterized protein n=1 Tax=Nippostrongylus brasiliensis TaxID=27835 RepID=A0A0N4YU11_NIPBR|nr:unnamed protein product [Nippostrongylus brasiliensis]